MWSNKYLIILVLIWIVALSEIDSKSKNRFKDKEGKKYRKKERKVKSAKYEGKNNDVKGKYMQVSDEKKLIQHLIKRYDKIGLTGRPVNNASETANVKFGLALIQIIELNEMKQRLTINAWGRYSWEDVYLTWDPKDYGGVDHVRLPATKIWTPDVVLFNSATQTAQQGEVLAVVSNTGNVLWIPMYILSSICPVNSTNYPKDEQTCDLKFGSWTYDGFKVDLNFYNDMEQIDVTDYVPSPQWALMEHGAKRNVKYYPCCQEPYIDLLFTLKLKRVGIFEDNQWKIIN